MKRHLLHMMGCLAMLGLLFAACSEIDGEEWLADKESQRTLLLNLNLTTRAAEGEDAGLPKDLQLWVYGQKEGEESEKLLYKKYEHVEWIRTSNEGEEVVEYTALLPQKVEARKVYKTMQVYAVINASSVKMATTLGESTSEKELKEATFTGIVQTSRDNEVLMYGMTSFEEAGLNVNEYNEIELKCKRCVSKLQLFMTRRSDNFGLTLKSATLTQVPAHGFLAPGNLPTSDATAASTSLFAPATGLAVSTVLSGDTKPSGFAEAYDTNKNTFTVIEVAAPFLLERKGLATWKGEALADNETADAYILTVNYDQSGTDIRKRIALENINRNTIYRIFLRVMEDEPLEVSTLTVDWRWGMGDIIIDITPGMHHGGGSASD